MKEERPWDGRAFCNKCGCPHQGFPNSCRQCGNVDFSLFPNVTYERGWLKRNPPIQKRLFNREDE